ncbi:ABC-2 family transporter protein [Bacillus sp. MHSD17]|nr:ABC-2 family transporter protein [Bacillus sp. MHSD17]
MIYIKLFLQYASQYIKTKLEYRGDFIVGLLSDLSLQAVNLIFILVVFGHTQALKGWSREEVIFIYGFLSRIVAMSFCEPRSCCVHLSS